MPPCSISSPQSYCSNQQVIKQAWDQLYEDYKCYKLMLLFSYFLLPLTFLHVWLLTVYSKICFLKRECTTAALNVVALQMWQFPERQSQPMPSETAVDLDLLVEPNWRMSSSQREKSITINSIIYIKSIFAEEYDVTIVVTNLKHNIFRIEISFLLLQQRHLLIIWAFYDSLGNVCLLNFSEPSPLSDRTHSIVSPLTL